MVKELKLSFLAKEFLMLITREFNYINGIGKRIGPEQWNADFLIKEKDFEKSLDEFSDRFLKPSLAMMKKGIENSLEDVSLPARERYRKQNLPLPSQAKETGGAFGMYKDGAVESNQDMCIRIIKYYDYEEELRLRIDFVAVNPIVINISKSYD